MRTSCMTFSETSYYKSALHDLNSIDVSEIPPNPKKTHCKPILRMRSVLAIDVTVLFWCVI